MQKRYLIPRFHDIALVVLTYGPLTITAKQLTIILASGIVAMNLWPLLSFFALLPAALILPFGWVSPAGRPLEMWLLVLLRYWLTPKRYCYQQQQSSASPGKQEENRV